MLREGGKLLRHVSLLKEDKWVFYEKGTPLPYEDTSTYKNRLLRTRLKNEQLVSLATGFGVTLETDKKITGPGMLFLEGQELLYR